MASPEELVFYHELAHAAHSKLGLLREKRDDSCNEIVTEFTAASLAFMEGRKSKLGICFEYLEFYAEKKKLSIEKAVLSLLYEIEKVIALIISAEQELETKQEYSEGDSIAVVQQGN